MRFLPLLAGLLVIGAVAAPTASAQVPGPLGLKTTYSTTEDRTVVATWDQKPGTAYLCELDGGTVAPCNSPHRFEAADGIHTFVVEGSDFTRGQAALDLIDTTLTGGPGAFEAKSGIGSTFECALDAGGYAPCGTAGADGRAKLALPTVGGGKHTLSVRARRMGGLEEVPATMSWGTDPVVIAPVVEPPMAPAPPVAVTAPARAAFTLDYRYRNGRFTRLDTKNVAPGAKVIVKITCAKRKFCPVVGKTTLPVIVGKRFPAGTKIAVSASGTTRTLTILKGKAPRIS